MKIEVLISTTNRKSLMFLKNIFKKNIKNKGLITCINQCISVPIPKIINEKANLNFISVEEKGISKSRNLAIKNATADICVIADDDVVFLTDCEEKIKKVYENDPTLDVAIFQIITPEGTPYKKYSSEPYELKSPFKIMQISSVEITFRRKRILEKQIYFNENLGLGAEYTKGEEAFFIKDCLKNSLKVKYFPIPIVIHPIESSGKSFSEKNIVAEGIVYTKLFPVIFPLVSFYFSIKKFGRYKTQFSILKFLLLTLKGNYIGLTNKKYV